jgi:DNA-binding GntR family transcriptional regulator
MKLASAADSVINPGGTAVSPSSDGSQNTLTSEAYRRLEEMIVTLELAPGSVVSEAILSRQIDIGTTPIREALHRLSREYLVQIMPRRGVMVTPVDVRLQLEILETRRELDRLLAAAAASRGSSADRAAIQSLVAPTEQAAEALDIKEFLRLDAQLNLLLARAARNTVTAETVARLHSISRRFWFFHVDAPRHLPVTARFHVEVVRAVAAGDAASAAQASDRLIDHLVEFARQTLPHA